MEEPLVKGIGNEVFIVLGTIVSVVAGAYTLSRFLPSPNYHADSQRTAGRTFNSEICPICIGPHRLAIETNCGHKFCGQCIRGYLNNRTPRDYLFSSGSLDCPMCRQSINLLLLSFSPDDASVDPAERREVEVAIMEYNTRFGNGPRSWLTYIRDCPVLVRHMLADFFSFGGLVWMFRLRVLCCFALAVLYLFSPLDIIPEAVFGLVGLLDDVVIVFLCAIYVSIIYRRFLLSRLNENDM